ncbi:zinc ribbon domain-containing protein [Pelosinus sp. IPA-1]|uniref:zinc ribbon domain-containing protein n=1 Tax=Pelosinus sp. IPA-1 TaxID=3029569 RepID=UPI00243627AE|nr:zinc ribbon domain-containing protein [Pelosinus sp. IPA-1]GMA99810.1 hypothetical protein PIPA1_26100 [Pelosinus sp. IPA-1]
MYCDSCGKKLSYNAKYCRHCGSRQKDPLDDTQPLPIINELKIFDVTQQRKRFEPWYKAILPKKPHTNRSKVWQILYDLFYIAICIALLYVLATFKTIKEYQSLTGLWSGLLMVYLWWKR